MKTLSLIVLIFALTSLGSCQKTTNDAQRIKLTPATSLKAYAGNHRIELRWQSSADANVISASISWNSGTDSMTVPIKPSQEIDSVVIDHLEEGSYVFAVSLQDGKGNISDKTFINGHVYGELYTSTIKNRAIQQFNYYEVQRNANIVWGKADSGAVSTEISFSDDSGNLDMTSIPVYITKSTLVRLNPGVDSIIRYRTSFLPELTAIDTFYTDYDTLAIHSDAYVSPEVLWDGDPSRGFGVWKLVNIDGTGTVTVVNDPVDGMLWRFYKPFGSHRTEGHAANHFQAQEGDLIYIGWKFKLQMPQQTTTNAIFQWKAYGDNMKQNFPVVLKPLDGNLTLMYHNPDYQAEYIWKTPTQVNTWIGIVVKMKISRDPNIGYIEFWYNGMQQVFSDGSTRYPARTLDADYCDPKWGIYGADNDQIVDYVKNLKIATTYKLADPM